MRKHHQSQFRLVPAVLISQAIGLMVDLETRAQNDAGSRPAQVVRTSPRVKRSLVDPPDGIAGLGGCPNPENDCCVSSTLGTPGCSDPACCDIICACDPFCCSVVWDAYCAGAGFIPGCGAAALCKDCQFKCPKGQSPPPNDECENATDGGALGIGDFAKFSGNLDCAGHDCPLFAFGEGNAWIKFTLTEDSSIVTLSYCGSVNSNGGPIGNVWLNLATECPCAKFTKTGEFAFSCPDGNLEVTWNDLPAGEYWYPILHDDANGANGNYSMTVTVAEAVPVCPNPKHDCLSTGGPGCSNLDCCNGVCVFDPFCCSTAWDQHCINLIALGACRLQSPSNDQCRDSLAVGDVCSLAFSTIGAVTDGPSHASCVDQIGSDFVGQDIWYTHTAQCDGNLTISLCGSAFNTKLAVYADCSCELSDADLLACNDDACGLQSELSIPVTAGECYRIRIGGFGTAAGNGVLTISNDGVMCLIPKCAGDFVGAASGNPDGIVDVNDLLAVINHWGDCD